MEMGVIEGGKISRKIGLWGDGKDWKGGGEVGIGFKLGLGIEGKKGWGIASESEWGELIFLNLRT